MQLFVSKQIAVKTTLNMAVLSTMAMFIRAWSLGGDSGRTRPTLPVYPGKGGLAPGLGVLRLKNLLDAADR